MIDRSTLPPKALADPFRPPRRDVLVVCFECGCLFCSDELIWQLCRDIEYRAFAWCCPHAPCPGHGYGRIIQPFYHEDMKEPRL